PAGKPERTEPARRAAGGPFPRSPSSEASPVSRLSALAAHPRRTLGALAVGLAAVGITVGSGATFTAHSANPANTFTAGTLTMSNSKDAAAVLSSGNMKPGDAPTGPVDIANTGTVAGNFKLSTSNVSDANGL